MRHSLRQGETGQQKACRETLLGPLVKYVSSRLLFRHRLTEDVLPPPRPLRVQRPVSISVSLSCHPLTHGTYGTMYKPVQGLYVQMHCTIIFFLWNLVIFPDQSLSYGRPQFPWDSSTQGRPQGIRAQSPFLGTPTLLLPSQQLFYPPSVGNLF